MIYPSPFKSIAKHPVKTGQTGLGFVSDILVGLKGRLIFSIPHEQVPRQWSPTGIAHGTLLHARVGRHPGETLAHSPTGKARGFLLPG